MQKHKLRTSVLRAAAVGAAAISATLIVGAGVASAAPRRPTGRRDAGGTALLQRERGGDPGHRFRHHVLHDAEDR